jgi:glycine reductase
MRVVHYLNQYFAGLGGEAQADLPPTSLAGPAGPGRLLQAALGSEAAVVGTVVCGDGLFADRADEIAPRVLALIEALAPDVVVAGPAFGAGRYGLACGRVCAEVTARLGAPALTGMHPDNAALAVHRDQIIVPTAASALGMSAAMTALARLALRLGRGELLGPAADEGYLPRGRRLNAWAERSASARALDMLLARLGGAAVTSEVALPRYDRVSAPPAVADLRRARVALVTEGGLVPRGNPDRLEWVRASRWLAYSLAGVDDLAGVEHDVIHGGYDAAWVREDPDRLLPVDVLRELVRRGALGGLLDTYYVTCGNHGVLAQMARYAGEIAGELRRRDVDAVLLVAT